MLLRRPTDWTSVQLALKSALAAGVAFEVGTWMPSPLSDYPYYASLGAIVVMYPALVDSIAAAARSLVAIALGMATALLAQWVASPNPWTVAAVVVAGVALGAIPQLGEQRTWVTFAALFTLTVGATNPDDYITAYGGQFVVGATIGVLVNFLIFPPLSWHHAARTTEQLRRQLVAQLETLAELLVDYPTDRAEWEERLLDLHPMVHQMRVAAHQARRARRANPRARRWEGTESATLAQVRSLERVALMTHEITSVLLEVDPSELETAATRTGDSEVDVRRSVASALGALASVLDDHESPEREAARTDDADATIDELLVRLEDTHFDDFEHRLLAGEIAMTARRCLHVFIDGTRTS